MYAHFKFLFAHSSKKIINKTILEGGPTLVDPSPNYEQIRLIVTDFCLHISEQIDFSFAYS